MKRVLVAGSGPAEPTWVAEWERQGYVVTHLDIEPRNNPEIVASMTDMGEIGTYDAVYCCHALEHLYPHEVPRALKEFLRVLESGGHAVIMVPDLEGVQPNDVPLDMGTTTPEGFTTAATTGDGGPITGLHLFYGDASQIEQYPYMAHHCGFVKETLERAMLLAGFTEVSVKRIVSHNLIASGRK